MHPQKTKFINVGVSIMMAKYVCNRNVIWWMLLEWLWHIYLTFTFIKIDKKWNIAVSSHMKMAKYKSKHKRIQQRILSLNNQVSDKSYLVHNFIPLLCKAANSILQCKEMFGVIIKLYLLFCRSTKTCIIMKESVQITSERTFRSSVVGRNWQE